MVTGPSSALWGARLKVGILASAVSCAGFFFLATHGRPEPVQVDPANSSEMLLMTGVLRRSEL